MQELRIIRMKMNKIFEERLTSKSEILKREVAVQDAKEL